MLFARKEQLKTLSVLLTVQEMAFACTESLIFEQDLTSFYETGKLHLAVDCRGNVLTWKWNSASILSSHLLCGKNLIAMNSTGPNWSHDGMKNFCN